MTRIGLATVAPAFLLASAAAALAVSAAPAAWADSANQPGGVNPPGVASPADQASPVAPAPAPAVPADRLTIIVAGSTVTGHNGTFQLTCHPTGGQHPDPANACAKLDQFASANQDPFAPVPAGQLCSQIDGGPATAQITGMWHGRPVNTQFTRQNGCQTSRWDRLVPVLPPESH